MNGKVRLSESRRNTLRKLDDEMSNSFFPSKLSNLRAIESYYGIANKVLVAFESCYESNELDNAYLYGRRFAKFSMEALPSHDYYNSAKTELKALRIKNVKDVEGVMIKLEKVVDCMDAEEELKLKLQREEAQRRREEAAAAQSRREEAAAASLNDVEMSAMQKLEMLRAPSGFNHSASRKSLGPPPPLPSPLSSIPLPPILPPPLPPPLPLPSLPSLPSPPSLPSAPSAPYDEEGDSAPPPPPPSYSDVMDASTYTPPPPPSTSATPKPRRPKQPPKLSIHMNGVGDSALPSLYNLSFGSHKLQPDSPMNAYSSAATAPQLPIQQFDQQYVPEVRKEIVNVRTLQVRLLDQFDSLRRAKKIEMFPLNTYQGRLKSPSSDSTNGCTVISPLVAAHHLSSPGSGIPDMTIESIIDNIAPPILSSVRSKLGLRQDALIVPSDVHDYLVDCKILHQNKFVGVCGGNILDDAHLNELLNMLQSGKCLPPNAPAIPTTNEKVAAALFFHEHVISILKLTLSTRECWYDVVDSLPTRTSGASASQCCSRTRCKDRTSLELYLKKYACSKFSDSNFTYMERNGWDDGMCDFDPRVFQAFVWANPPPS
uniref:USP8 dimerisation domain-containing protein n=1 Tax=Ditylum brightwellii TaxID=49249 RepID=A0A7S4VZU4_9STRA|mmetsp:Transcript_23783/g.31524  ORF Transcript_23783/g.31524 Transcript_23783/m.31524 type:complete len:600 (+) Transcript_23783:88-1887(+)